MARLSNIYRSIHKFLPGYLYLLPLTAGTTWIITLSVLLIYWIASGRPTYPRQANPYIPFVSDIAAWHLKPFFIIGCTITSISFIGTILSIHYARHSQHFYGFPGSQSPWRQAVSILTLVAGIAAGVSLFFISVFDTAHAHQQHRFLLISTFGGLGLTAIGTGIVWTDVWIEFGKKPGQRRERIGRARRTKRLRFWAIVNFGFMILLAVVGIAFMTCIYMGYMRSAGILEWTVTYVGCFWLLSFSPFFTPKQADIEHEEQAQRENDGHTERSPLLGDQQ